MSTKLLGIKNKFEVYRISLVIICRAPVFSQMDVGFAVTL